MSIISHEQPETSIIDSNPQAIELSASNPIAPMLQAMIEKGITPEGAAAMEKMVDLYFRMEGEAAKKAFAAAKCALQAELPRVIARRPVPNSDGTVRYVYAAYEDVMSQIGPYLSRHGFSVSFTMRSETADNKDRICAVCKLTHSAGYSELNEFAVRVSAPPKSSDAQADGATRSYARRGALCDCLNIVVEKDDDARLEGNYITAEQAAALEKRVEATGSDKSKFLKLGGAAEFSKIRTGKYAMLDHLLIQKEKRKSDGMPATYENVIDAIAGRINTPMGETEVLITEFLGSKFPAGQLAAPAAWQRLNSSEFSEFLASKHPKS